MRRLVATLALMSAWAAPASAGTLERARADAEWILSTQLPDGAIPTHTDRLRVWPYLGNFAANGLAGAARLFGEDRYADAAWRWLRWYADHQDAAGFVTDYDLTASGPVSTGTMDSTDAYAGTFLLAVERTWEATHDLAALHELEPGVVAAVAALAATTDDDGLTWARPGFRVKYLMDQAEVYAGLLAAARLGPLLGDVALAEAATADAARLKHAVARLWNRGRGAYDWAVHESGVRQPTTWRRLYPDALQQAWAVAFGLVPPGRAARLMRRFRNEQPDWDRPGARARYDTGVRRVGYWAPAAWAFARVGDTRRAARAGTRLRAAALASGRAWPFTPADAGQLVALAAIGSLGIEAATG